MAKEIKLTRGLVAIVDDEDFEELNKHKWQALKSWNTHYATRHVTVSYRKRKIILMHRQIMNVSDKSILIDHADHNGLNCQRSNLRLATTSQNSRNTSSMKNSSSKFLGVDLIKKTNNWRARIKSDGKVYHIGIFSTEKEAAKAYDLKAVEFHGEFANLNFKNND